MNRRRGPLAVQLGPVPTRPAERGPAPAIYSASVTFSADISDALPYVNASVENGEFIPALPVLVFREGGRKYALRPHEISVSSLVDREQAAGVVRAVVDQVNRTWENRHELEPSYETWERPKVLDILRLLPGTNCRQCGLAACMAFAAKLAEDEAVLDECPALAEDEWAESLASLEELGL